MFVRLGLAVLCVSSRGAASVNDKPVAAAAAQGTTTLDDQVISL